MNLFAVGLVPFIAGLLGGWFGERRQGTVRFAGGVNFGFFFPALRPLKLLAVLERRGLVS